MAPPIHVNLAWFMMEASFECFRRSCILSGPVGTHVELPPIWETKTENPYFLV